jgi:bifunctional N-acetylglucosamine-1-phosphate-uridyltransferase/glucosamine-1-phosphate-acetyltransferase GlmU-like protein
MLKIVEFKDLTPDQQSITLCNSALMSFAPGILQRFLAMIVEQKQPENTT